MEWRENGWKCDGKKAVIGKKEGTGKKKGTGTGKKESTDKKEVTGRKGPPMKVLKRPAAVVADS